jgi:hypothetical protein
MLTSSTVFGPAGAKSSLPAPFYPLSGSNGFFVFFSQTSFLFQTLPNGFETLSPGETYRITLKKIKEGVFGSCVN